MSIVTQTFIGYETGGTEEIKESITLRPAIVTTPAPPASKETYTAKHDWKDITVTQPYTASTTDWITVIADIRFGSVSPSADSPFLYAYDESANYYWNLTLRAAPSSGVIRLNDANAASQGDISGIAADTWYRIAVKFKRSDTSKVQVYFDDDLKWDIASMDTKPAGTSILAAVYNGDSDAGGEVYAGHLIVLEDDGTNIDDEETLLRDYSVLGPYNDANEGATGGFGDALDAGRWDDASDLPRDDTSHADYAVGGGVAIREGGVFSDDTTSQRDGPSGDPDTTDGGTFMGAEWVWRARSATGGFGQKINFWGIIGNDGGDTLSVSYGTLDAAWGNSSNKVHHRDAASAYVPIASETFRIGMKVQPGLTSGTGWLGEMAAFLLYQEAAPVVGENAVDFGANF